MSPRMRCSLPSEISDEPMLFPVIWKASRGFTSSSDIENAGVDRVWDGIVEEFTQDQAVTALVEELNHVCRGKDNLSFV